MESIGMIILIIMFLWLILHREKDQEEYNNSLASGAMMLPRLAQHYVGID